jgi:glycosyltransferase involved in cell wall biosynthesis
MRIWIVHQHAIPPIVMGPTRHYDLAKQLIELGHEVHILAGTYCHNNFLYIAEPFSLTRKITFYGKVPFVWFNVPAYTKNSFRRLYSMAVFALNLYKSKHACVMPKPDVIIGSSPSPFAAWVAYKMARRFKIPFVYEIRDLWPATLLAIGNFSKYHPLISLFKWIEKKLLKESVKIISVLPGVKDYLCEETLKQKLIWLPNAINFTHLTYQPPKRSDEFTIFYAGAFSLANDLETLILAAKILESHSSLKFNFKLIGEGPLRIQLCQLIERLAIKNIQILPTVNKEKIHTLLATADLFVGMVKNSNLYQYGTSLNKMVDYMSVARPIVFALDSPYSPITEANAGLTVPPESPESLAQAILKIASLPYEERMQLGLNGRRYAEENYNMEKIAAQLIDSIQ